MAERTQIIPITGIPLVERGADIADLILDALKQMNEALRTGDVLLVCSKIIAKAEGRTVRLDEVAPSTLALEFAQDAGADPRLVELVLREARRIVKMDRGILIAETRHGFVCANAGVDLSNTDGGESACLLPADPDESALALRKEIQEQTTETISVVITDSFGRPWRTGQLDVAVGVAGFEPVADDQPDQDLLGLRLQHTRIAIGDALAAVAGICFRKDSGIPACIVRGCPLRPSDDASARDLLRSPEQDLFR